MTTTSEEDIKACNKLFDELVDEDAAAQTFEARLACIRGVAKQKAKLAVACPRCRSSDTVQVLWSKNTRSSDEGQTSLLHCTRCDKRWRVG